jgi:hypothetical protein
VISVVDRPALPFQDIPAAVPDTFTLPLNTNSILGLFFQNTVIP